LIVFPVNPVQHLYVKNKASTHLAGRVLNDCLPLRRCIAGFHPQRQKVKS